MSRFRPALILTAITLAGLILRVIRIGARDYWHDEIFNILKTTYIFEVLTGAGYVSNHPPLFAVLAAIGRYAGLGTDEGLLRLVPALIGVATIPAVYGLARAMFDRSAGLFAAFFVAVAPMHVHHSQDLKVYILLPLTATFATWALYRAVQKNETRHWALYAVAAALTCYSDVFAAPYLAAVNLWALVRIGLLRDRFVPWAAANAAGALLFVPQLWLMVLRARAVLIQPEIWWIPPPSLKSFVFYMKAIAFGYSDSDPAFKVALVLFLALCAGGFAIGFRKDRWAASLLAAWFVLSVGITAALSILLDQSLFLYRAMLPFAVPLFVFSGLVVAALPKPAFRAAAVVVWVGVLSFSYADHFQDDFAPEEFPHRPGIHPPVEYEEAMDYILAHWREGDRVVISSNAQWLPVFWYGFRENPPQHVAADNAYIRMHNDMHPRSSPGAFYDPYFPIEVETYLREVPQFWFVFADWERQYLGGYATEVWRWMETHYHQLDHYRVQGLELFYYARTLDGEPIEPVARLADTAVSSSRVYRIGETERRVDAKTPDIATVPKPESERRSSFTLAFENADGFPEAFRLRNESEFPARARVEWLQSAALVQTARFNDAQPERDVWRVNAFDAGPAARALDSLAAACAMPNAAGPFAIFGEAGLPAGTFVPFVRIRSHVPHPNLTLQLGNRPLPLTVPEQQARAQEWTWLRLQPIRVDRPAPRFPLRVEVRGTPDASSPPVCLEAIAFAAPGNAAEQRTVLHAERVELAPGEQRVWPVPRQSGAHRIDAWAFEETPGAQGLWIYYRDR